ncbi:MAG TPA: hypothetical protein VNQ56_08420 [Pseudolabrys sp.]|nr:hypothetical protein [Pseudolabrys sp.]
MKQIYRAFLAMTLIAFVPAATLSAVAQDEEQPRWFGYSFDNKTTLAYGVPDSDYVVLYFSCAIGKPVVNVYVQDEESSAERRTPLLVQLSAGADRVEFSGKTTPNEDSGGADIEGRLPLDDTLRRILSTTGTLEIVIDKRTQRYAMGSAAQPAAAMLSACNSPKPTGDLDVTVINKAKLPLQSFAYSEAGANSFDSDRFGYEPLAPGASRTLTIPDGRKICTFDISVVLAKNDEECCDMGNPAGRHDLCRKSEFVVHD